MRSYEEFFVWTVTAGWGCGLEHPIQWCIQAWRTPGGTLSPGYYETAQVYIPRMLVEFFDATHMGSRDLAVGNVLEWTYSIYDDDHPCCRFFHGWSDRIQTAIDEHNARMEQ